MLTALIGRVGSTELLLVLLIVLVVFGPKQIPKLAKGLGKTVSGFKKGVEQGLTEDDEKEEKAVEKEA